MTDNAHLPLRERLAHWVAHLTHILPAQAPIGDFVHHNTLHGFQHLPFAEALAAAQELTGAQPYWPRQRFLQEYAAARITRDDLLVALADNVTSSLTEEILPGCTRQDLLLTRLLAPADLPSNAACHWRKLESEAGDAALLALCQHLSDSMAATAAPQTWQSQSSARQAALFGQLAQGWTLRRLLLHLSGEDVLARVRSVLQHHLAAHLDLGLAAWTNPAREQGFYAAWRASAALDLGWDIDDLPNVRHELLDLPAEAIDALAAELPQWLANEAWWPAYLESLSLELPGWSGMFIWRDQHPDRQSLTGETIPVAMVDYLAVRMVLERLLCSDLIRRMTGRLLSPDELRDYFAQRPAEFYVRDALRRLSLPEELQHRAAYLLSLGEQGVHVEADWLPIAEAIAACHVADEATGQLYALLQPLALSAEQRAALSPVQVRAALDESQWLTPLRAGQIWLQAYERHYRQQIFAALAANQARAGRQQSLRAATASSAQVVFCMDDREEGTRRHLEEIAPSVATYGAAGFFGVAMYWQGIDDAARTALCPVVVQPVHVVQESVPGEQFAAGLRHAGRRHWRLQWRENLYQQTRTSPLFGPLLTALAAIPALLALIGKTLAPGALGAAVGGWVRRFEGRLQPELALTAEQPAVDASPTQPQAGFTTEEQVIRVEAFLRTIGLTKDFAPLVLMLGHGSGSANNPHLSAYDCGACSGRHGGPNARVFAAMANRPAVRAGLAERGLLIPDSCWFVAAEHNTCDDSIDWYDLNLVPAGQQAALDGLLQQLAEACRAHAVERCRRLASAPLGMTPWQGLQHVRGRRYDIAQARPELGHATNAVALVGRRQMSQGLFLDRRAFLISYDPEADLAGEILEKILLAVCPVGAGINLEYYFSTVNNGHFGCGSKITHNLTGLFGVMEGAESDLRTGLPWQMVEIHEPMRLLVVIEQTPTVLGRIVGAQPALQELINNAWVIVAALDPTSGQISEYCSQRGWLPWSVQSSGEAALPQVARSQDWFSGQREALPPALLLGGAAC